MPIYAESLSPVGWNTSTAKVNASNQNTVPVVVYPGDTLQFRSHPTYYPMFALDKPDPLGAKPDIVVNSVFRFRDQGAPWSTYTIFTDAGSTSLPLGPEYSLGVGNIEGNSAGPLTFPDSYRIDTSIEYLPFIEFATQYIPTDFKGGVPPSSIIIGLTMADLSTTESDVYDSFCGVKLRSNGDMESYYGQSVISFDTVDGSDFYVYDIYINEIRVEYNSMGASPITYTSDIYITNTLDASAIADGHTLLSGGSPIINGTPDEIYIPVSATPGTYSVNIEYFKGFSDDAYYQVGNSSEITNSPTNGVCWAVGEVIHITANTGTITSVVSTTPGLIGVPGGIGTSNATFTITSITSASGNIRVSVSNGVNDDYPLDLCNIIMILPPITNTVDNPTITTDDAANTLPTSIYQCVGVAADVKGPGFLTGDVTWSILDSLNNPVISGVTITGQNTEACTFFLDDTVPPGNYTLLAEETADPSNQSTHSFTLVALPPVVVGTNQPYVGGHTQFNTTFPFPVTWAPAEVNATTGLATWTTPGIKTVSYTPVFSSCVKSMSFTVYPEITVAEYNGSDCVYVSSGDSLALTVTGGSGTYIFSITGQNMISDAGVITAGLYAGNYIVSITDPVANLIFTVPVCIGNQSQFCTAVSETVCTDEQVDSCCELSVNCGETVSLSIPSFHMRVNGMREEIAYSNYSLGTVGAGGYLKSGASTTDASANTVNCADKEAIFEIVTSLDMADVANAPFGIGFSKQDGASGVSSIDIGVIWYTSTGVRNVEVRKNGVVAPSSTFPILQGDVVSAGFLNGKFVLYINNLLRFETADFECCGEQFLDISIEQPHKSLGGNISGLTWNITTPGTVAEVGFITPDGVYNSPTSGAFTLVEAQATAGNGVFNVRIRNIKPSVRYTRPDAFLAGKAVSLWVGPYMPNFNEPIRLAKDGSPDAIQNPMMIDCGTLEASANFQEAFDYQDFENDLGQIYHTSLVKESATLTATFLEVRDLYKLKTLKPEGTLHAKNRGVTEFSVGGKSCDLKELRVIMVIGQPGCDDKYDVLYLPRVQNKGNLGLEIGKKTNGKYELNLTALPDYSRPAGKQLYSIFQIDDCGSKTCN